MTRRTRPDATGSRLLVADDNPINQKVATALLAKIGYRTDVVETGRDVLEALARTSYAAVLMDCRMPVMDGFEATIEIRKQEEGGRRTPIIAMTAGATEDEREKCLAAGMDDYLSKPIVLEDLATLLDRWAPIDHETRIVAPPEPPEQTSDPVLDPAIVAQLRALRKEGETDGFTPLARLFLKDSLARIETLREAVTKGDVEAVRWQAHSLRGISGTLGATRLSDECGALESAAEDHLLPDDEGMARVESEFERFEDALRAAMDDRSPE